MKKLPKNKSNELAKEPGWREGGKHFIQLEKGKTYVRLLPFVGEKGLRAKPAIMVGKHFYDDGPIVCPQITHRKQCPICDVLAKLARVKDEDTQELIKQLKPNKFFWMRVIERGGGSKPKILEGRRAMMEALEEKVLEEEIDVGDPIEGFDLKITKSGKGLRTRYHAEFVDAESPLAKNKKRIEKIIKAGRKLPIEELLETDDEKLTQIASMIEKSLGVGSGDNYYDDIEDDDTDEYEPPKKKKKGKSKVEEEYEEEEDDDDEEEEDDDDDDDEEEEDDDDDDEEEEEDEEEEVEEEPKKKKKKKKPNAASSRKKLEGRSKRRR